MKKVMFLLVFLVLISVTNAQTDVNINIDTSQSRDIPKELHGVNQNWFKSLKLQTSLMTEGVNNLQFIQIRFPGGTVSNYYNWEGYYPNWNRYEQEWGEQVQWVRYFYDGHVKPLKGESFINYADSMNKDVVMVANVHNSMNFDLMLDSLQTLSDAGINVKYLEIGNELYFPMYGMSNDTYLYRAETLSQHAKNIFPNVKTAVVINREAWKGIEQPLDEKWRIPNEDWYDAVIVHAYLDDDTDIWNTNKEQFVQNTLYEADNRLQDMVSYIKTKYPGKEIWITEWNYFSADSENLFANTYKNSFHTYNFFINMLKYQEITMADYHVLSSQTSGNSIRNSPTKTIFSSFYPKLNMADEYFKATNHKEVPDNTYSFDEFFVKSATYWPLYWIGDAFDRYDDYIIIEDGSDVLGAYFFNQNSPNEGSISLINKKNQDVKITLSGMNLENKRLVHKFINESWDELSEEGSEIMYNERKVMPNNLVLPPYSISYIEIEEYVQGDINNDGQVNINDVLDLITKFNEQTADTNYDLNQDNKVNVFDLVLVAKNIGK